MTNAGFVSAVVTSIGKSIIRHVVAITVLLLLPVTPTLAEDRPTDAQCRNFADFAVRNAQKVRDFNCTTLPWNDPSLSLNKDRHFRWCRMMRTETVEKQMEVLFAQSSKCEYCRWYDDAIHSMIAEIREFEGAQLRACSRYISSPEWFQGAPFEKPVAHEECMKSKVVSGGSTHYDVAWVKPKLDAVLGQLAGELAQCKRAAANAAAAGTVEQGLSAVPQSQCVICHQRSGIASSALLQLPPKRVSTDPTIARQPPAFTPVPERRRTPRDTGRGTSSGSDQATRGGEPCGTRANPCKPASGGSNSSAMDRLGGGGTGGAPSGGGRSSGGSAPRPSGVSGGAASGGPPGGGSAPNINSNTINRQPPAFGTSPGLR